MIENFCPKCLRTSAKIVVLVPRPDNAKLCTCPECRTEWRRNPAPPEKRR